ncbi:hypothetical protein SCANM63S_02601 [Streptomyces canarius]
MGSELAQSDPGHANGVESDRPEPQKGMNTVTRPRILVVGAGFAGVDCVRRLERKLAPDEADVTLVTPFAYQLYLPLLPQVASGVLTPQLIALSLRRSRKYRTNGSSPATCSSSSSSSAPSTAAGSATGARPWG